MPKPIRRLWPAQEKEPRLYLVGCHSGLIKIGRTRKPRSRLDTHRVAFGKDFAWAHLFGPDTGRYEWVLKKDFGKAGTPVTKHAETFRGITKAEAIAMCRRPMNEAAERRRQFAGQQAARAKEQAAWMAFKAQYMAEGAPAAPEPAKA